MACTFGIGVPFAQVSCHGGRQFMHGDRGKPSIARRALGDQIAVAGCADHGERRGAGIGAAFGAA